VTYQLFRKDVHSKYLFKHVACSREDQKANARKESSAVLQFERLAAVPKVVDLLS
jgi:hypothetical protein